MGAEWLAQWERQVVVGCFGDSLEKRLLVTGKKSLNKTLSGASYISELARFRCSFRVGIEVLLAVRCEQRPPSWPHCPSERRGEGVKTSSP